MCRLILRDEQLVTIPDLFPYGSGRLSLTTLLQHVRNNSINCQKIFRSCKLRVDAGGED